MRTIKNRIDLSEEERKRLERLTSSGKASARSIKRASILLDLDACDYKASRQQEIAKKNRVDPLTVSNVARQFCEGGVDAAINRKVRKTPAITPKITGEVEARIIALACGKPPEGRNRWTLQLLADKSIELKIIDSITDVSVMRV
jgi:hypothetical protein